MFESKFSTLPLWNFERLSDYSSLRHFVSGRRGGVSSGEKGSLNLSYKVGDMPEDVRTNRRRLSDAMGIEEDALVFPVQTHSLNVKVVHGMEHDLEETDALVCNVPGICISVMSADCVPVLLFDPVRKVVAAAHAGWKGTVGKIAVAAVRAMEDAFGSQAGDIIACIGPSISPQVYEVGPEVIAQVHQAFGTKEGLIHSELEDGKGYFDLWEANRVQLTEAGLRNDHIEISGVCTFQTSEEFFSARKSKNQAGRFAAGIMLA